MFQLPVYPAFVSVRLQRQKVLLDSYAANFQPAFELEQTAIALPKSCFPNVPQLKEVFDFIEAHYHQGITLCDVAQAVGYSPAYLTNRVGKLTGETVNCWIVKRRMTAACLLLLFRYTEEIKEIPIEMLRASMSQVLHLLMVKDNLIRALIKEAG